MTKLITSIIILLACSSTFANNYDHGKRLTEFPDNGTRMGWTMIYVPDSIDKTDADTFAERSCRQVANTVRTAIEHTSKAETAIKRQHEAKMTNLAIYIASPDHTLGVAGYSCQVFILDN